MTEVLRYEVGSGTVLVEVDENSYGVDHPARNEQGILSAEGHFILRMSWSAAAVSPTEPEE